jgi:hypothetical protein
VGDKYLWLGNLFQGTAGGEVIQVSDGDVGGYFADLHSTVVHVDFGDTDRGFGLATDGVHHFTVLIPNEGYFDAAAGGSLALGFRATRIADHPNGEDTLGIDNIMLSTKCSNPYDAERLLEHEQEQASQDNPRSSAFGQQQQQQQEDHSKHKLMIVDSLGMPPLASQPRSDDGAIDSFYCSNADYPCEGNKVYVCHYSLKRGYATYCVPEPDSDILRFYDTDYCGPCQRSGRPKAAAAAVIG